MLSADAIKAVYISKQPQIKQRTKLLTCPVRNNVWNYFWLGGRFPG